MAIDKTLKLSNWSEQRTRRDTALLGVAAAIVVALLVTAFVLERLRLQRQQQIERLETTQLRLSEILTLLRTAQSSRGGFLYIGNEQLLEQYNQAVTNYPARITEVRQLAATATYAPELAPRIAGFDTAAQQWFRYAPAGINARRASALSSEQLTAVVLEGRRVFETIDTAYNDANTYLIDRDQRLVDTNRNFVVAEQVAFTLLAASMLLTIGYAITLVRRIGLYAAGQQQRQVRQEAYGKVVSTLNGATQFGPLVRQSLPLVLDSVGAQAGVIYSFEQNRLLPAFAVGLDNRKLQALEPDEGLPGRALQEDRPIVVADLPPDTPYRINLGTGDAGPRSLANVPLRYGKQVLGVLVVASVQRLGDEETQQLRLSATQLATAISNVRAFEETQGIAKQLAENNNYLAQLLESSDTLQDIGRELVVQSDLQTLLDLVCNESRRLLRADYAAVATISDPLGTTRWAAVSGTRSTAFRETVFPPHHGTAGRVIDRAGPVVIQDFGNNPEFPAAEFPVHSAEGMRSAVGVPLFRRDTPVGALIIAYRSDHTITDAEIELATALASYASIAIENARLVTELQHERDVAEERAQELAVKNREVERANRLKSEFVANMSHELRTPLNSILALSQILLDRLDGELNDEQDKQVRIIERNGHNLLRLINEILDLSKIEAGRIETVARAFAVRDLIDTAVATVAPLANDKGLKLLVEVAPDVPPAHTDDAKLKQILLNLLSNAVKFTERGSVTIRAAGSDRAGGWLTIEVQDTGIGIAPEDQPTVWEEFRQIDGSLARQYEGTGLGLAIVKRLAALLCGSITLQSAVGRGSTFRLEIPARLPHNVTIEPTPAPVAAPRERTAVSDLRHQLDDRPLVLIVDDDIEVLYILEKYLRDEGYRIESARSGDEAITKARELHPFAMTLDVMLPERDGWDVIREIKSDPLTSDIQIIMISMLDNSQLGFSLGATDYLVKPISRTALLQRLAQIRNGKPMRNVAVIDDDALELRVLSLTLQEEGFDVTTFNNGPDALRWLEANTPDLITLDLMMPGMDGFAVLESVRAHEALRDVPVLVITAKDILSEDRQRLNGSIAAVIQKGPRQRQDLLSEIRDTLDRRRAKLVARGRD